MARTMDLMEAHIYSGHTYGPGAGVTLPDDAEAQRRIVESEAKARAQAEALLRAELSVLPSGHPYHQLLGVQGGQPPAYEGDASPVPVPPPEMLSSLEATQIDEMEGSLGDGVDPTGQTNQATLTEAIVVTRSVPGGTPSGATAPKAPAATAKSSGPSGPSTGS